MKKAAQKGPKGPDRGKTAGKQTEPNSGAKPQGVWWGRDGGKRDRRPLFLVRRDLWMAR